MNRTTWTGRISRGYLVLPLAESTMDLHPVVQALSRWASPKTEILQPFWSAIPMLDAHWRSSSVTQALQQDPPRGCKDPGRSCSSKLPSIHWPLASWELFCSWCRNFIKFPSAHSSSHYSAGLWAVGSSSLMVHPRETAPVLLWLPAPLPWQTTPQPATEGEATAGSGFTRDCLKNLVQQPERRLGSTSVVTLEPLTGGRSHIQ